MPAYKMKIHSVGAAAQRLLAEKPALDVLGITSRGTFLGIRSGWVVFISTEGWRGPLTINIWGEYDSAEQLALPPTLPAWQAEPPQGPALSAAHRSQALQSLAEHPALKAKTSPSVALLRRLVLNRAVIESQPEPPIDETWWQQLLDLQHALHSGQSSAIAQAARPWLGRGTGLTPNGDDLLLGLLLALKRWGTVLAPQCNIPAISQGIVEQAWPHTTRLSASLLACAAQGQADERLLLALDGIMTGQTDLETCAQALAGWGNSSGLDALLGMAVTAG